MQNLKKEESQNIKEIMLTRILDYIQAGIFICNEDYSIEYVNPALRKKLGNPDGRKCHEYFYRKKEKCPWCRNPDVINGRTVRREWFDPVSGHTYDLIETPLYNPDGSISKLKIIQDITESKEKASLLEANNLSLLDKVDKIKLELSKKTTDLEDKDNELKKQKEILEKLFINTHFNIALLDRDFNFIRVNKAYADAAGKDEEYFTGKNHFDLYPDEENQEIFTNVLHTGVPFNTYAKPFSYTDKPESEKTYWDWSLNPIKDETGKITELILILLDVTEKKKTEIQLEEARRLSDIGALAATVAHELRSPLGVIQAVVYNIKRKYSDEKLHKRVQKIEKKINESEKIINNLLNYSRIKQPYLKKIHLYNFLNECVYDIKNQYLNSGITITCRYEELKDTVIKIDPFQMREVFLNILNNAYQAIPDKNGTIEMTGRISGASVVITIKDNGQGIEKEDLDKIFNPFFTSKSKGTGLGLTICRELIHLHKGKIDVKSVKGEGTQVCICLPMKMKE
jgi:PAS domain S-box-containing protein